MAIQDGAIPLSRLPSQPDEPTEKNCTEDHKGHEERSRLGFCHDRWPRSLHQACPLRGYQARGPVSVRALPKEWGPAKHAKRRERGNERCRLGGQCHIARSDIGRGLQPTPTRPSADPPTRCWLGGPCDIARPDIGRGRDALLRDPAWHVQKTCNGNIWPFPQSWFPISLHC